MGPANGLQSWAPSRAAAQGTPRVPSPVAGWDDGIKPHGSWGPTMASRGVPGCLRHGAGKPVPFWGSVPATKGRQGWAGAGHRSPCRHRWRGTRHHWRHKAAHSDAVLGANRCCETSHRSQGTQPGSVTRRDRERGVLGGATFEFLR